jgi:hemoglobin/transferrin/lactoferrin receptor protein
MAPDPLFDISTPDASPITILKKLFLPVAMAFLFLLQASYLQAADPCQLEDILVTARGVESQICLTPGGTAVMEAQDLFHAQDPSVTHTLSQIPGVEKLSDSAWGSEINIRGMGRNRVVFLIDGCRVNTATDINGRFGFINPNEIERIEVLKGPVSALYGSGAMGGVINIITKKGKFSTQTDTATTLGVVTGSNPKGFTTFWDTALNSKNFWIYAFGAKRDYDAYDTGSGNEQANSFFEDGNLSLKSGFKWNPENITEMNIQYSKGEDIGIPGKGLALPVGPTITYPDSHRTLVSLTHHISPVSPVLAQSDLTLFYQEIERDVDMEFPESSAMDSIKPWGLHETLGAKWQNVLNLGSHSLVTGLDIWSWAMETSREKNFASGLTGIDTPLADARQTSAGFFMEDDMDITQSILLNLGGRIDYIKTKSDELYDWIVPPSPAMIPKLKRNAQSNSDTSWDAHAGLTWRPASDWSMTLLTAAAYRAPDLMERYKYLAFSGGEIYGNPDLDPERSWFFEYGLHYRTSNLRLSGAVYANFLKDMITEELNSGTTNVYQMENVNKARLLGGELEAEYHMDKWRVFATLAYTRGTDETNDTLAFVPPLNGMAGIGHNDKGDGLWGEVNLKWAAKQDKIAAGETQTPGWATVNARAGYRFTIRQTRHELMIGLDNIFDVDYANHLSTSRGIELSEPGFNALAAWKMEF